MIAFWTLFQGIHIKLITRTAKLSYGKHLDECQRFLHHLYCFCPNLCRKHVRTKNSINKSITIMLVCVFSPLLHLHPCSEYTLVLNLNYSPHFHYHCHFWRIWDSRRYRSLRRANTE